MKIRADLHLHSCLSPCALLAMSPSHIADRAAAEGIAQLALTDHMCSRNAAAFETACRARGLAPVFGFEATTAEEAHVLCLFATRREARRAEDWIWAHTPRIPHRPMAHGDQVIVNARDEVMSFFEHYVGVSSNLSIDGLTAGMLGRGGLVIPSHVDRPANSLGSQLGRIPELPFSAVEVSAGYDLERDPLRVRDRFSLIASSDAHQPSDIGRGWIEYEAGRADFDALREALSSRSTRIGRRRG